MTNPPNVPDLEAALLERAERLASEYVGRARDNRDAILKDKRQRLRAREERLTQEARASADRLFRRQVQAAELRLQGDLDRQRWALIQSVLEDLPAQLNALRANKEAYDRLLRSLLARAVKSIGDGDVIATLGTRDLERLRDRWDDFSAQAAPGGAVTLDSEPLRCSGGVRVTGSDGRVRVDATFEGRVERYKEELIRLIAARLFAHDPGQGG